MPEQIKSWECSTCKRVHTSQDEARNCEEKHKKFQKVQENLEELFKDFFPAIAIRSYFVYQWGTYIDEKIPILALRHGGFNFEKGILYFAFEMVVRGKIVQFKIEPGINVDDDNPLKAVKEFLARKKDSLMFLNPERTVSEETCDLLTLYVR